MKVNSSHVLYFALGIPALVLSQTGYAADSALDEVVVSATRTERPLSQTSASVSVLDRADFEEQQANNVADVMKSLPNVNFGGGPRTFGEIPTIRGYSGADVTLMVDGARRNDIEGGGLRTPLYLDPYFLDGAEVVKGSSSSLYGSGGNGGVMSFRTLSAKNLLAKEQRVGGDVSTGYRSGDDLKRYNARVYGQSGQFDALLGLGYQELSVIRLGGGGYLTPNVGHNASNLLKLGYQATNNLRFEMSQQGYRQDIFSPNNPQVNSAAQAQLSHNTQDETILKADTTTDGGAKALSATLYYTALKTQFDPYGTLAFSSTATDTVGGNVQNTSRLFSDTHVLTYGVDYFQDTMSAISGTLPNPISPDGNRQVTGVFVQDEIVLSPGWRVTPSVRSDSYNTSVANGSLASSSDGHVSPKLSTIWSVTESLNLYGSYGESFRAPTLNEMYQNNVATSNFFSFQPNTQLKPQLDRTTELGGNFKRSEVFADDDSLRLRATVFQTTATDLIQSAVTGTYKRTGFGATTNSGYGVGMGAIFQNQNVSSANRSGVELEGQYGIGAWQFNAGYSYLRVTDNTSSANLFSPPDKLSLQVRREFAGDISLLWNTTAVADQDYDSTVLRQRVGYVVHDLYLSWMLEQKHKLRVDAGISNLFDKRYLVYQSSNALANVPEMGQSINVSLSGAF